MAVQNYHTSNFPVALQLAGSIALSNEGGMLLVPAEGAVICCSRRYWDIKNCGKDGADADSVARLFVNKSTVPPSNAPLQTADDAPTTAAKGLTHEILPGEAVALRTGEGLDNYFLALRPETGVLKVRLSGARVGS